MKSIQVLGWHWHQAPDGCQRHKPQNQKSRPKEPPSGLDPKLPEKNISFSMDHHMKCQKVFGCLRKKSLTDGREEDWQFLKCFLNPITNFLTPITNPNFQVFSYPDNKFSCPDNKSKLSDELSENAHHQVSPTNPSLRAWNDNRFQLWLEW